MNEFASGNLKFIWNCFCSRRFFFAFAVCSIATLYYQYLNSLYLVDEVLEVSGPRELSVDDKLTIRVVGPENSIHLKSFVEKYSLCPCVHEIQIIWLNVKQKPEYSFVYAHTHSKVTFDIKDRKQYFLEPSLPIETESVLLMDASVDTSCSALAFMQSTWRSSKQVAVGMFPLLHNGNTISKTYVMLSSWHVWWHGMYSVMSSSALVMAAAELKRLAGVAEVESLMGAHPECYEILPSLWSSGGGGAGAPIWTDIGATIHRGVHTSYSKSMLRPKRTKSKRDRPPLVHLADNNSSSFSNNNNNVVDRDVDNRASDGAAEQEGEAAVQAQRSLTECLNTIVDILSIKQPPMSTHKSTPANKMLFW